MEFNGFKIFPTGNAKLNIVDGVLRVSEISNSGLDGVLIDTQDKGNYTVNFGELGMIAERKGVLKTSTLQKNLLGQVVTSFESFKWLDEEKNMIVSGYNLAYLPIEFTVFGKLGGETIFEINSNDLQSIQSTPQLRIEPVTIGIILTVIGIGVAVWAALRTKKTTSTVVLRDNNGNVTGTATIISEDPVPFEVEVNGEVHIVDEYGIKYDTEIPDNLIGNPMVEYETIAEQITGVNLGTFEITSIELNTDE